MPELPEVETVAVGLREELLGRGLSRVRIIEGGVLNRTTAEAVRALEGARLVGLSRKGKFLLFHLSDGSILLFHLKMTGRFLVVGRPCSDWLGLSNSCISITIFSLYVVKPSAQKAALASLFSDHTSRSNLIMPSRLALRLVSSIRPRAIPRFWYSAVTHI